VILVIYFGSMTRMHLHTSIWLYFQATDVKK